MGCELGLGCGATCALRELEHLEIYISYGQSLVGVWGEGKPGSLASGQARFRLHSSLASGVGWDLTCLAFPLIPAPPPHFLTGFCWEHFLSNSCVPKSPLRVCFWGTWPKIRGVTKREGGKDCWTAKNNSDSPGWHGPSWQGFQLSSPYMTGDWVARGQVHGLCSQTCVQTLILSLCGFR